jgi:hypothetical protein
VKSEKAGQGKKKKKGVIQKKEDQPTIIRISTGTSGKSIRHEKKPKWQEEKQQKKTLQDRPRNRKGIDTNTEQKKGYMSRNQQKKEQPVQSDLLSRPSPARREIVQHESVYVCRKDERLVRWTKRNPPRWNQEPINTSAASTPKAVKHQEQCQGNGTSRTGYCTLHDPVGKP